MSHFEAVKPGSLVLVTGVNGNIGTFLALDLLHKGYKVKGTVRALSRANYVKKTFASFGDKFDLVEVPDLAKPGAFDAALEGVNAIYHAASPVSISAKRAEEQYVPAVDGTLSLLRSAAKKPSVKRFIYLGTTGSVIMGEKDASKEILTRDDWNTSSEPALKDPDSPYNSFNIYCGSKIAAERSAFEFAAKEKPAFSVTSVLPSMVVGPVVKELTAPPPRDDPGIAIGQQYNTFANPARVDGISPVVSVVWVHLQDVADLFSAALTSDKTAGVRLLAHAGRCSWEQFANAVRKEFPDRPFPPVKEDAPTMMFPGATEVRFDTALEEELLGGKWRSLDDAALSAARDLIKKEASGWDKA